MFALVVTLSALFGGAVSLLCPLYDPTVTVNVAHPTKCGKYMSCVDGIPVEMPCPDGLEWNEQASYCDYPGRSGCVRNVPEEVARLNASELAKSSVCLPPEVSACPEQSSGINEVAFVKHKSCRKFVACSLGQQSEMQCPAGLYWSAKNCRCDYVIDDECDGAGERPAEEDPVEGEQEPNVDDPAIPENPVDEPKQPEEPNQGEGDGAGERPAEEDPVEGEQEPNEDDPAIPENPVDEPKQPEEPNQDEGDNGLIEDPVPPQVPENPEEPIPEDDQQHQEEAEDPTISGPAAPRSRRAVPSDDSAAASSGDSDSSGSSGSASDGSSSSSGGNQALDGDDDGTEASGAEAKIRNVAAFAVMLATLAMNSL